MVRDNMEEAEWWKYLDVNKHWHTHTQPFYGSLYFVLDNLGEPVPEETFTHSHSSWSSQVMINGECQQLMKKAARWPCGVCG